MKFTPSDCIDVIRLLNLSSDRLEEVKERLNLVETQSVMLAEFTSTLMKELSQVDQNLSLELSSNQSSLLKAGSLEWQPNRFLPLLHHKRYLMVRLGNTIGIEPNLDYIESLLKTYGQSYSSSHSGRLIRN